MVDTALAGRCGIYCGACGVYRAHRDGGEYLEHVMESWCIPREKMRCNGCGALTPECWGTGCETVKCLDGRGYRYCYECAAFDDRSCERYEEIARKYLGRGEDIRAALLDIKSSRTREWLEEQERRWRYPYCGEPVSWFGDRCFKCGNILEKKST